MSKTMCKVKSAGDLKEAKERAKTPKFICKSCYRVSEKEKHLCKPEKI